LEAFAKSLECQPGDILEWRRSNSLWYKKPENHFLKEFNLFFVIQKYLSRVNGKNFNIDAARL